MLILTRTIGQSILLADKKVEIKILRSSLDRVKFGILAARDIKIFRKELVCDSYPEISNTENTHFSLTENQEESIWDIIDDLLKTDKFNQCDLCQTLEISTLQLLNDNLENSPSKDLIIKLIKNFYIRLNELHAYIT